VGDALATYLHRDRPSISTRRVFIRVRAPLRGFAGPVAISCIVRRAIQRADLPVLGKGVAAHLLAQISRCSGREWPPTCCATAWRRGYCVKGRRCLRSERSCATGQRPRPRSTPKSTSVACARLHNRGPGVEVGNERAPTSDGAVPHPSPQPRVRAPGAGGHPPPFRRLRGA
jgi:hypothetical protein